MPFWTCICCESFLLLWLISFQQRLCLRWQLLIFPTLRGKNISIFFLTLWRQGIFSGRQAAACIPTDQAFCPTRGSEAPRKRQMSKWRSKAASLESFFSLQEKVAPLPRLPDSYSALGVWGCGHQLHAPQPKRGEGVKGGERRKENYF